MTKVGENVVFLSNRQQEFLQLSADGYSPTEICVLLGLKLSTVRKTLSYAYSRLGASDRTHAVALCLRKGMIT